MYFHNLCVPETCAHYKSWVHSLLLCDVFCQSVGLPEFLLGFPPLLLSIAEVKGFLGSSPSCCSIKAMFYTVRGISKTCRLFNEVLILLLARCIWRNTCNGKNSSDFWSFFQFSSNKMHLLFPCSMWGFPQMPAVPFHLETIAVVNSSLCLDFNLKESENPVSLTTVNE